MDEADDIESDDEEAEVTEPLNNGQSREKYIGVPRISPVPTPKAFSISQYQPEVIPMAAKTREERIELIDQKIAKKQAEIEVLEAQKKKLLHPISMRAVLTKAKEAGMSPEEVAEKLGIEIDE